MAKKTIEFLREIARSCATASSALLEDPDGSGNIYEDFFENCARVLHDAGLGEWSYPEYHFDE